MKEAEAAVNCQVAQPTVAGCATLATPASP
jgi:hypothetical protein